MDRLLLQPHESLKSVLQVMLTHKMTAVYVVTITGEPLGVVTLQNICQYLVTQEAKQKAKVAQEIIRKEEAFLAMK